MPKKSKSPNKSKKAKKEILPEEITEIVLNEAPVILEEPVVRCGAWRWPELTESCMRKLDEIRGQTEEAHAKMAQFEAVISVWREFERRNLET